MKVEELTFRGSDPGAVKYGNFINYYSFHNAQERIHQLNPQMFPSLSNTIICLDVGCNTGDLTKELYLYLKMVHPDQDVHILGIDIDPILIERAKESHDMPNITFMAGNIMLKDEQATVQKYLATYNKIKFDIMFCFSVTMWIHINNGDTGLMEFLKYMKNNSMSIIIEPQPWNCYRNAQRRLKKSGYIFQYYECLKIRSNIESVIETYLSETFTKVYESQSSWKRKIQSYHCKNK